MKSESDKARAFFERLRKAHSSSRRSRALEAVCDRLSVRACNVILNCSISTLPELRFAIRHNYLRFCRNFGLFSDRELHRVLRLPFPIRLLCLTHSRTKPRRHRRYRKQIKTKRLPKGAFDILRSRTEDLGATLYVRASWKDPWLNLIPRDSYPKGAGYVRSAFVVGRSEPSTDEEKWTAFKAIDPKAV